MDEPTGGPMVTTGLQKGPVDGNEGCDGPQREQDGPTGGPTGTGKPTGEPDEPIDQFCSSCNQKKPLIDFGRFLTCNACR